MLSMPAWGFSSAKLDVNTEELKARPMKSSRSVSTEALQEGSKLLAIHLGISGSVVGVEGVRDL
jgi:hypothetical protein